MPLLEINKISLAFGGIKALTGISIAVEAGELYAVIGPNGAGKTCLLNCITGFYKPQSGSIHFEGRDIRRLRPDQIAKQGVARTFQNVELFANMNVIDNLLLGRHNHFTTGFFDNAVKGYFSAQETVHRRKVEEIVDFLEMEKWRKYLVSSLPYGVRKRVELGRALAQEPKLLLLDEPMAGMNLEEREDIARFVIDIHEELGCTIVMIEHDMDVVMDISERVCVLDFGRKIGEGSPREVQANPEVQRAYLGQDQESLLRRGRSL
ncbi:MAG: ABC transporter ATP-binding protein [Desulfomonile tiedjei]|uniref:ABC transporter ATP-binding protein n=1 Tax=Desulfomonile tiedjei TaxID=2358 RepID=A0A9D6UX20_9BACT|nr:ABC transporter ATP-binding protein [Desulfomonile tiedjei]